MYSPFSLPGCKFCLGFCQRVTKKERSGIQTARGVANLGVPVAKLLAFEILEKNYCPPRLWENNKQTKNGREDVYVYRDDVSLVVWRPYGAL